MMFKTKGIISLLDKKKYGITIIEKGTGGLLAETLTKSESSFDVEINGSIYPVNSFASKHQVKELDETIDRYGMSSKQTVQKMAELCRNDTKSGEGRNIGVGIVADLEDEADVNEDKIYKAIYAIDTPYISITSIVIIPKNLEYTSEMSVRYQQQEYIVECIIEKLEELLIDSEYYEPAIVSHNEKSIDENKIINNTIKKVALGTTLTLITTLTVFATKNFIKKK